MTSTETIVFIIIGVIILIGAFVLAFRYFLRERTEEKDKPLVTKVKRPRAEKKKRYEPKINNKNKEN